MDTPLVSILIPIYNVEKFIGRCVESLMEQSYKNIEYIFVNDCTPDKSIEILNKVLNKYPQRKNWRIINHSHNKGLAASRNTGLENAKGEWIAFVDSDDYLDKSAIENLTNGIKLNQSDIIIGEFSIITNEGIYKHNRPQKAYKKNEYIQTLLRWNEIDLTLWGKLFKKELFTKGNIKSYEGYNLGEDFGVTARLSYYANYITFINKIVYYYENSNTNSYTKTVSENSINSLIYITRKIIDFYKEKSDFFKFKKHIYIGLTRMKCWIYYNNCNNKIEEIDKLIQINNLDEGAYYKFINNLLKTPISSFLYKLNRRIKFI